MQSVTLSDIQSLLSASESRTTAALAALSGTVERRFQALDEKLDPLLADQARHGVRLEHLESSVESLEKDAPTNTIVSKSATWLVTAVLAALVGAAANMIPEAVASLRASSPAVVAAQPK